MSSSFFSSGKRLYYWCLLLLVSLTACQGTKSISSKERRSLDQLLSGSPVFNKSFTGFALYDPEDRSWLYRQAADKYYTPASNTKILTLFTALEVLGDTFPLLHYEQRRDSLIFWGSANPAFLDPALPMTPDAVAFLRDHEGPLFFTDAPFSDRRFGDGWAWDDFPYYYQPEKAGFPLFGNLVHFFKDSTEAIVRTSPPWFRRYLVLDTTLVADSRDPVIIRDEHRNHFRLNTAAYQGAPYERWIPFRHEPEVVLRGLEDTLARTIHYLPDFEKHHAESLTSSRPDTLYRRLMQQSDNFIAEQLLLMCADKVFGEMNTGRIIAYAQDSLLGGAPDRFEWVDGSGLSRYNLFTPRSVVYVLEQLYRRHPEEWLFDIFPAGGQRGTVRNWYGPDTGQTPYVFAKTGSLRHRHCLSGYLRTRSGRTLIFSFMHNNFTGSANRIKREMERVLRWIYESL